MTKRRRKDRTRGRQTTPSTRQTATATRTHQPGEPFILPERPGQITAGILLGVIIVAGHQAAPAVINPSSVPRPWLFVLAGICACAGWGATATLTTLAYSMIFFRNVEPARAFLRWVAHYAGIGAILGTLLGCRVAWSLASTTKTDGQPYTFLDFLSEVSNTATMLTLLMIATCWWRLRLVLKRIADASLAETPTSTTGRTLPRWTKDGLPTFVALFAGNLSGFFAGWSILRLLL